jgi:hypothetical protein
VELVGGAGGPVLASGVVRGACCSNLFLFLCLRLLLSYVVFAFAFALSFAFAFAFVSKL